MGSRSGEEGRLLREGTQVVRKLGGKRRRLKTERDGEVTKMERRVRDGG